MAIMSFKVGFGSDLHTRIVEGVRRRVELADSGVSGLKPMWSEAENTFRAYTPLSDSEQARLERRRTGKQEFVTLVIPYSTALLLTAYTYWASVFLQRSPVFQYQGLSGQGEDKVLAAEAVINYQMNIGEMLQPLHVWLLDVGKYGRGIIGDYWDEEIRYVAYLEQTQQEQSGLPIEGKTSIDLVRRAVEGYKGNRLYNIRPFDFLADPRVSLPQLQKGEFCGTRAQVSWNTILKKEAQDIYFNVEQLKGRMFGQNGEQQAGPPGVVMPGSDALFDTLEGNRNNVRSGKGYVPLVEMYIELVPSLWGLGSSPYPEKWMFTVADNAVVVGARPLGCLHNQFPFQALDYEVDGYTLSSRGILEILEPLNYTISWLVNSHFHNVRSVINGTLLVDPSRVVMEDLNRRGRTNGGAGGIIRATPAAYGTDVKQAMHQFAMMDVTQQHLKDMQVIEQIMQRIVGANDNVMGMLDTGGRKTATEVRTAGNFGVNRLQLNTAYFSAMGFAPLSRRLLMTTNEYMGPERKFRIAGDQTKSPQEFILVNPMDLAGEFDYAPVDGTLPIDRFAMATLWRELLAGLMSAPALAQQYDVGGIFSWIAKLAGMRNIDSFKVQVLGPGQAVPPGMAPVQPPAPGGERTTLPLGNVGAAGPVG